MLVSAIVLNPFIHVHKRLLHSPAIVKSINNAYTYRLNYHFYDLKWLFMKNVASILVNTYYTIASRQPQ